MKNIQNGINGTLDIAEAKFTKFKKWQWKHPK